MYGMTFNDDLLRNAPGERWSDKNAKCHLRPCKCSPFHFIIQISSRKWWPFFSRNNILDSEYITEYWTHRKHAAVLCLSASVSWRMKRLREADGVSRRGVSWHHGETLVGGFGRSAALNPGTANRWWWGIKLLYAAHLGSLFHRSFFTHYFFFFLQFLTMCPFPLAWKEFPLLRNMVEAW